ncbi:hypothetical protein TrST_g8671 [Triparma strigata]|uniref:Rab-GAP TBC domain-containing protein n=1 Tax=Triparma strigata TaxID=1606541 RepID=A0A9W7EL80_9STRA|nr:hypothetical protein TrST_g8671 [Triparma strigata]
MVTFLSLFAPDDSLSKSYGDLFEHPSCIKLACEAADAFRILKKGTQSGPTRHRRTDSNSLRPYDPPPPLPGNNKLLVKIMSFLAGSASAALFLPSWHGTFHPLFLLHRSLSRHLDAVLVRYLLIRGISSHVRLQLWDCRLPLSETERSKSDFERVCAKLRHGASKGSHADQNIKVIEKDVTRSVFGSVRRKDEDSNETKGVIRQMLSSLASPSFARAASPMGHIFDECEDEDEDEGQGESANNNNDNKNVAGDDNEAEDDRHHRKQSSEPLPRTMEVTEATVRCASFEDVNDFAVGGVFASAGDSKMRIRSVETLLLVGSFEWGVGYCQGMDYVAGNVRRIVERGNEGEGEGVEISVGVQKNKSQIQEDVAEDVKKKGKKGKLVSAIRKAFHFWRNSNDSTEDSFVPLPAHSPTQKTTTTAATTSVATSLSTDSTTSITSNASNTSYITYKLTSRLFTNLGLAQFYAPGLELLKSITSLFKTSVALHLPVLSDHFDRLQIDIEPLTFRWFQTLFIVPSIPTSTVCSLWDTFVVTRRFDIFIKFGLAILKSCQPMLLNGGMEDVLMWFGDLPRKVMEGRRCLALALTFDIQEKQQRPHTK